MANFFNKNKSQTTEIENLWINCIKFQGMEQRSHLVLDLAKFTFGQPISFFTKITIFNLKKIGELLFVQVRNFLEKSLFFFSYLFIIPFRVTRSWVLPLMRLLKNQILKQSIFMFQL